MELYIRGEHLYLKELDASDVSDEMMEWFRDEELVRFYTNSGRRIEKPELVRAITEGKAAGNNYTLGIFFSETEQMIGTVKLGPINAQHRISDLATLIGDRRFLGKGYSAEAIRLGTELAFTKLGIRRLYGGMYLSNTPSIRTYLKAGWLAEGRLKGYYWVDGRQEDRLLVGCYNPVYFSQEEIEAIKNQETLYYER